jgi:molecular chaperone DnaK
VKDAEAHAADDKKRRELIEARNQADGLVHQTERNLAEWGDKVPAGDKAQIESAVADLKEALQGEDQAALESKSQTLLQLTMKLGEQMYRQSQGQPGGPGDSGDGNAGGGPEGGGANGAAGDGVVDAEFEEVDENRKGKSA